MSSFKLSRGQLFPLKLIIIKMFFQNNKKKLVKNQRAGLNMYVTGSTQLQSSVLITKLT